MMDTDTDGASRSAPADRRRLAALRLVVASAPLRNCQLALGLARCVDLAQLVVVSAYLFGRGGASLVAVYGVVRAIAPAVAVPVVSGLAGRVGHGRLLALLAALACLATGGIVGVVAAGGPVAVLLGLAALVHVAVNAYRPVTSALAPSLVRRPEELVACTAAGGFLDAATTLTGPVLGGALLGLAGAGWALAVTLGVLAAAGVLAARLPRARELDTRIPGEPTRGAVRTFFGTPPAAVIGVLLLCQTMVRGALYVLLVVFTVAVLRRDESMVGLLLGAIGVGGMLGLPVALAVVGRRRLFRSCALGLVLWGAPLALAAGAPHLAVVLVLLAVVGIGNDILDVGAFTALPRVVPSRAVAQAFGVLESLCQLGMAVGAGLAGLLLTVTGPRTGLLLVGLVLPVVALVATPALRRFDARLEHRDVEVELLRRQPMLAELPMPVLDTLAGAVVPVRFAARDVILRQGDPGDSYFLIVDGTVEVVRDGAWAGSLTTGDAFGEIALVRDTPRTASVIAATPVVTRVLDRDAFLAALNCHPAARSAAHAVAAARSSRSAPAVDTSGTG